MKQQYWDPNIIFRKLYQQLFQGQVDAKVRGYMGQQHFVQGLRRVLQQGAQAASALQALVQVQQWFQTYDTPELLEPIWEILHELLKQSLNELAQRVYTPNPPSNSPTHTHDSGSHSIYNTPGTGSRGTYPPPGTGSHNTYNPSGTGSHGTYPPPGTGSHSIYNTPGTGSHNTYTPPRTPPHNPPYTPTSSAAYTNPQSSSTPRPQYRSTSYPPQQQKQQQNPVPHRTQPSIPRARIPSPAPSQYRLHHVDTKRTTPEQPRIPTPTPQQHLYIHRTQTSVPRIPPRREEGSSPPRRKKKSTQEAIQHQQQNATLIAQSNVPFHMTGDFLRVAKKSPSYQGNRTTPRPPPPSKTQKPSTDSSISLTYEQKRLIEKIINILKDEPLGKKVNAHQLELYLNQRIPRSTNNHTVKLQPLWRTLSRVEDVQEEELRSFFLRLLQSDPHWQFEVPFELQSILLRSGPRSKRTVPTKK